jgi:hypothetical protein
MPIYSKAGDKRPDGLSSTVKEWLKKNAEENEELKAARNARRWKAERNPVHYSKQLVAQREAYAALIANEGREVRAYAKIEGNTPAERKQARLDAHAERNRTARAKAPQKAKDAAADRKWVKRAEAKGMSAEDIAQGLKGRIRERSLYENHATYGSF